MLVEIDRFTAGKKNTPHSRLINPDMVTEAMVLEGKDGHFIEFRFSNGERRNSKIFKDHETAMNFLHGVFLGKLMRLKD